MNVFSDVANPRFVVVLLTSVIFFLLSYFFYKNPIRIDGYFEALFGKTILVSTLSANVRDKPRLKNSNILRSVDQLDVVNFYDVEKTGADHWLKLSPDRDEWISENTVRALLPISSEIYGAVNTEKLNVRNKPDALSEKVGYIVSGDIIELLEIYDNYWLKIRLDNLEGFVHGDYVNIFKFEDDVKARGSSGLLTPGTSTSFDWDNTKTIKGNTINKEQGNRHISTNFVSKKEHRVWSKEDDDISYTDKGNTWSIQWDDSNINIQVIE